MQSEVSQLLTEGPTARRVYLCGLSFVGNDIKAAQAQVRQALHVCCDGVQLIEAQPLPAAVVRLHQRTVSLQKQALDADLASHLHVNALNNGFYVAHLELLKSAIMWGPA